MIAGRPYVDEVFRQVDPAVQLEWQVADGERVQPGQLLYRLTGPARSLLTGERTALNFLQVLSGDRDRDAALCRRARRASPAACSTRARPCPACATRRSTPSAAAAASTTASGLYDGILIKENHIVAAGSIAAAVAAAQAAGTTALIEVEVETLDELRQALDAGARHGAARRVLAGRNCARPSR